mgnify:CR=1 FL=1
MASKEEIQKKNIAEANDALAEQLSLASQIQDQMSFVLRNYKEKLSLDKNSVDLTKKALDLTKNLKSEYDSVKDVQNDLKKNQKLQNDIARQKLALEKEGGKTLKDELSLHRTREGSLAKAQSKLAQMNQDKAAGKKVDAALYKQAQATVTKKQEQLTFAKENLSFEAQQVLLLEQSNEELQQGNNYLNDQLGMQKNLVKSQSLFTSALSGANKLLQKMGFGDLANKLGLNAASEKAKEMTYRLTDGGKKSLGVFGKMRVGIASFGAALKSALGPMALIGMATSLFNKFKEKGKEAMDYMAEISSETVGLTRELGLSAANGAKVAGQARAIGGAMGFTHEQSTAAASAIYGQLQGTEQLGAETMKTFMKLNIHGGISGDVLGRIYDISKITGKEAGKVAQEIASQAQESLKTMKVNVSMKNVMESVSKVSNRVALNFKGSGTAITAAVVQSKKLGIEMAKVEDIANSLLNIEDSIAAEMEAELLTGKDLNLEKAREAALNGDNAKLMEELANQGITAADYSKMNRIQQDALAKSLGMSGEEMADMLTNQKKNEASNQDTLSLQKDSIAAMTSMASLAEGLKNQEDAKKAAMGETGKLYMEFHHIMHEISMKLAPILNAAFAGLWKILKPILQGVSDWLSDSKVVEQITATITNVFSKLAEIIGRVWAILSPIRQAIFDIVMTALPPFLTIMETLWKALQPTFNALVELAKNMIPIIADILTKVGEIIGEILVGLQPVFEGLGNLAMSILPIIQNIFTFFITISMNLKCYLRQTYEQMVPAYLLSTLEWALNGLPTGQNPVTLLYLYTAQMAFLNSFHGLQFEVFVINKIGIFFFYFFVC